MDPDRQDFRTENKDMVDRDPKDILVTKGMALPADQASAEDRKDSGADPEDLEEETESIS